jgi:hypothetical protein
MEMQQNLRMQILYNGFAWICVQIIIYLSAPTRQEVMKTVGSHGSSSLLFLMKLLMVWHFVSNSHKVMTALIVMLPSNCSRDFSAIS